MVIVVSLGSLPPSVQRSVRAFGTLLHLPTMTTKLRPGIRALDKVMKSTPATFNPIAWLARMATLALSG